MRSSQALKEKQPFYKQIHDKVIFQHDNARPHGTKPAKTYLEMFKWEVLPHKPYSPDILRSINAYSDRWHMAWLNSTSILIKIPKKWVDSWIASKNVSLFRHEIQMLPERWEEVVASDGQYFQWHVFY
ncbi:Mariner Mos1 transposase [Araneus ventricosus]|uniref:Mariner Mos1 transposase n=1 Tax=Araneus ventricosus TaxID=182803 RepID=A0A4Y2T4Y6_ARAVE|nr:Mariner Mos1 transposase [Araneus ventricosus]